MGLPRRIGREGWFQYSPAIGGSRGRRATALGRAAADHPQLVVRQAADNATCFSVAAALAPKDLQGEPLQRLALAHRTMSRRIQDERIRGLKGADEIAVRAARGGTRHHGK